MVDDARQLHREGVRKQKEAQGLPPPTYLQGQSFFPTPPAAPMPPAPQVGATSMPGTVQRAGVSSMAMPPRPQAPSSTSAAAASDRFASITHFHRAWGLPPRVAGLTWDANRAIYDLDRADREGDRKQVAALERRAAEGVFMQPYRVDDARSAWRFRWVRVPTPVPEVGAPYTVLGDVETVDSGEPPPSRQQGSWDALARTIRANDMLTLLAAKQAPKFDMSLYSYVGVYQKRGQVDGMVYHIEPRKDLPLAQQEQLWDLLCTQDAPAQYRMSPEDCKLRRYLRDAAAKGK